MPVQGFFRAIFALVGLTLAGLPVSHADTLVIDAVRQAADIERPVKGQSMAAVEARFGAPNTKVAATGQPPISRWVYDRFTVYFEGDNVLHTVVHR